MYIIRKEFAFSASHQLELLPETHPCSRLHGHNYVITFELRSKTLNVTRFVDDYRSLEPVKKYIDQVFDHKNLNDFLPFNPTAELIAKRLYEIWKNDFPNLYAVECSETPKTSARYEES